MVNQKFYQLGTAPSVIRELFAYGLEQAQVVGPENVFDYSLGNPSIPAPAKVNQSIHDILNDTDSIKVHGYSMACGFDAAREAIAANLNCRFGMELKPGNLFLTCGAAPGLIAVIKALLAEEDSEIMAVAPFFPEYRPFTESNGGRLVVVPADTRAFQIDLSQVERRITPRTQAIIINSPNNPSGVVYTEETLRGLAVLLERKSAEYGHPIYIIADEPYRFLTYDGVEVPSVLPLYQYAVVISSFSKNLSLPGERVGYVAVSPKLADRAKLMAGLTLTNRILGENRMIVANEAGTTRDAIDTPVDNAYGKFIFTDTAGLRKRSNISDGLERYMVVRALAAVERSRVALILVDATVGFTEQDSKVAGYAHEQGKACIIVVNKWDAVEGKETNTMELQRRGYAECFSFMGYAPIIFISAQTGYNVNKLMQLIRDVDAENGARVPTGVLNEMLARATARMQPPSDKGRRLKIYYLTQASTRPPTFVAFVNAKHLFHFSYQRYLINQIRENFGLEHTPIRLVVRERGSGEVGAKDV